MLTGLEDGDKWAVARDKVQNWVDRRQYLRQVIWYQRFTAKFDADLLQRSLRAAIEAGDDFAVRKAVSVSAVRHGDMAARLIERVFLPAIEYLTAKGDTSWVTHLGPHPTETSLFQDLKSEQVDVVLASLVRHARIDYRVDEILASLAASWPTKVVDFFGTRLKVKQTSDFPKDYKAIPYKLHKLRDLLATIPDYLVEKARCWFDEDERLFTYRGGRLLSIVFPQWSQEFECFLLRLVDTRYRANLELIVNVLHNYEGQEFTHSICKAIVEALPTNDPLLKSIEWALDSTGFVRGEFGRAETYRRKKTEIEPWLEDPRKHVQLVAKRHILSLDRQIASEQRECEEELELRKRDYGEGDQT